MKICFLITGLGIGGAEKHLLKFAPKIKFEKFIISLTNKNDFGKEIEKKGVKVYYLGLNKFNFPLIILKFGKLLIDEKPDIIDSYLIHSNLFARIFGRIFGVNKIICSIQNDYSDLKILNFLDKITENFVNLYIPNSRVLLNYLHIKNKIPLNKIKIIPSLIDLEEIYNNLDSTYDIKQELGLDKNNFLCVCVARLHKQKSVSTLIKAIKFVKKNIFTVILGDGEKRNYLMKLTEKLGLKNRIFFLGSRKDVINIVNSSDLFILPSLKEGMSNALLEAMSLKKICIVSDIPQNRVLIKDNVNGMLFKTKNYKDLARKIEIVYRNPNLNFIKERAYKEIINKYEINNSLKKYMKIVEKLYYN